MVAPEVIYQRAPGWLQTVLLNAYALRLQRQRYGSEFSRLLAEWDRSQWWEPERLQRWQNARVRDLVRFAYESVPFYRRRLDSHGVAPHHVRGIKDLPLLPILTKDDVRAASEELIDPRRRRALQHGRTSGTTGSPLQVAYDREMCVANNVADWRQKQWAGMAAHDWCGMLLGRVIVPTDQASPPFWRANFIHRQVWFSAFHMHDENLPEYITEMRRRKLDFLEGYPSTLFILALHLLRRGERLPLRAIFTSSETLHQAQREALTTAFECRIFDYYGMAERVIFAGECGRAEGKHVFDEYGVTEVVDDDGRAVPDGELGWLVGTSLWNRGMPLIRYRTTDMSAKLPGRCTCGRGLSRIASVTTKAEDIVVTADGRFISPSVLTHPFKPLKHIVKSQLVQEAPDRLLVKLVTAETFEPADRESLVAGLRSRLGAGMRIDIELVSDLPPEPSGKFRWVISRVPHHCRFDWAESPPAAGRA